MCHQSPSRQIGCALIMIWTRWTIFRCLRHLQGRLRICPPSSPVSSPVSPGETALFELVRSYDDTFGSPATSLSITDHMAILALVTPPDSVMIQTNPALLVELAECFNDFRPSTRSDPEVDRPPVFFLGRALLTWNMLCSRQ